jgi:hypothetical protein
VASLNQKLTASMITTIQNVNFSIQDGELRADAKQLLRTVFKSGNAYLARIDTIFPNWVSEARKPIWIPAEEIFAVFERFKSSEKLIEIDPKSVIDDAYDWAFSLGLTKYKSAKRLAEEHAATQKELADLRAFAASVKEKESRGGVNPAISFLNDVWFPVSVSAVFCVVIGSFSYEIMSETSGMNPVMNILLSVVYVLFPILTAIRQYQFDIDGFKLSPLTVVMVFDMLFTAYHVGWLREPGYVPEVELHPVLKIAFIVFIPLMQKVTNDMIMKIRSSYQKRGWLPSII